jgi:hypothetical protein
VCPGPPASRAVTCRRMQHGSATGRARSATALLAALIALLAVVPAAPAAAKATFKPRIHHAMGIIPARGSAPSPPPSNGIPVAYHGGPVMRNATIHTVFWSPGGYRFSGAPGPGILGYQGLIQQFLADAAHDSGSTSNVFSVLNQYGDGSGNGSYTLRYNPAVDSVTDTHPYPAASDQCPSPSGTATCVSDLQIQQELDRLIGPGTAGQRGLSNVWFVFLPPDVDTCLSLGSCATNAYAGYHSLFDLGHGPTVYAVIPDPLLELTPPPGSDPEGNPEAEATVDTVAHEAVEALTDPDGTGWMDPNGFEAADKCETGPQEGTPLGSAPDGSPYNQVINGHEYLIQDIWSNARDGCTGSTCGSSAPRCGGASARSALALGFR